jgi:methyltransferase (TIGR00027 family)
MDISPRPSGVGLTAVGVAAFRAMETARSDALFHDPWAERFVAAANLPSDAGRELFRKADLEQLWTAMAAYMVVRTRFFDQYLLDAAVAGIPQVVILAAGLDTRAFRLPWPPGTRLWEVDLPAMIAFKEHVLGDVTPVGDRTTVPADLRLDWSEALRQAGHRPVLPTVWLAEGLVMYLSPEENDRLVDRISALSATGSRLALCAASRAGMPTRLSRTFAEDLGEPSLDLDSLWRSDFDQPPADLLARHGWRPQVYDAAACAEAYGRPLPDIPAEGEAPPTGWMVTADRP